MKSASNRRRKDTRGAPQRPVAAPPAPVRGATPRVAVLRGEPALLIVLACFVLSGFAALLYETVWTRQFAFVFGTSELAVATVLAGYMGGLAVGAAVAGRLVDRLRRPLLVYALLELGIGAAALLVPAAVRGSTAALVAWLGGSASVPAAEGLRLTLFYLGCSFAILLVPAGLMGATLPILARFAVRDPRLLGGRIGALYAANTVGAVAGTAGAAFVLIPRLGLQATVLVGVSANVVCCLAAAALARRVTPTAVPSPSGEAARPRLPWFGPQGAILPLILVSGAVSFSGEVLWTRLLGHVLGGSMFAFGTMLATFLTGIALGSALAARRATTSPQAMRDFAASQLAIAVLTWAAFQLVDRLPGLARSLGAGAKAGVPVNAVLASLVLLPATLAIGTTFPFAVRVLARDEADAGPVSARVYAWNTLGAIFGAVGSGFFLLPLLGYHGLATLAIFTSLSLALVAGALVQPRRGAFLAAVGVVAVLVALLHPIPPWRLINTSPLSLRSEERPPAFAGIGRSATVALTSEGNGFRIRTNGLPEGMIVRAYQNQQSVLERWLGALPSLARPDTRTMLVVGLGAGSALEAIPATVGTVDVVELEPRVIEANRWLAGRRAVDPLADPRVRLHMNDARSALLLTGQRYDAVVSQPSHPWTAGSSHLYTREFFQLVRARLSPEGVFVQWIELAYIDEALLRTLAATLLDVFPQVRMYRPVFRSGVLFVASATPLTIEQTAVRAIAASPASFVWAGVQVPEDVAAALAADEDGVRKLADGAPLSTDDHNLMQVRSPSVLTAPLGTNGGDQLLAALDPLPAISRSLQRLYLVRRLIADQWLDRAQVLVASFEDPQEQRIGSALLALARGRTGEGIAWLEEVLQSDPGNQEARMALLRTRKVALLGGDPGARALVADGQGLPTAVAEGWRLEAARDWAGLRALEGRLATASVYDPGYADALMLRAVWGIESGDPRLAREALPLLDRAVRLDGTAWPLRARAAVAAARSRPPA